MADTHKLKLNSNETIKNLTIDGSDVSEALKASNLVNAKAENCVLIGGSEDCLDVVRGNGIFSKISFKPSKKTRQSVTVKGGASILITDSKFIGKAKKYDITVGDFTIYDAVDKNRPNTKLTISDCEAFNDDGSQRPVTILLLRGELKNNLKSTNVKVESYPSWIVNAYFCLSKLFLSKSRKAEAKQNLKNSPDVVIENF